MRFFRSGPAFPFESTLKGRADPRRPFFIARYSSVFGSNMVDVVTDCRGSRFRNRAPRAQRKTRVRPHAPDRHHSRRKGSPHRLAPRSVRSGGHAFRAFHRPTSRLVFAPFSVGRVIPPENRPSSSVSTPASTRSRLQRPPSPSRESRAGFLEVRRNRPTRLTTPRCLPAPSRTPGSRSPTPCAGMSEDATKRSSARPSRSASPRGRSRTRCGRSWLSKSVRSTPRWRSCSRSARCW